VCDQFVSVFASILRRGLPTTYSSSRKFLPGVGKCLQWKQITVIAAASTQIEEQVICMPKPKLQHLLCILQLPGMCPLQCQPSHLNLGRLRRQMEATSLTQLLSPEQLPISTNGLYEKKNRNKSSWSCTDHKCLVMFQIS